MINNYDNNDHKDAIDSICKKYFWWYPHLIQKMSMGICNEVYSVTVGENEVIIRLSLYSEFLKWSKKHIPILKEIWINVPNIIAEEYDKKYVKYMFQILDKIRGRDIDYVISNLSDLEIDKISTEISNIFDKVKTIKGKNGFWLTYWYHDELKTSRMDWIEDWIKDIIKRGRQTWLINDKIELIIRNLVIDNQDYLNKVSQTTYLCDINAKNVMIHEGQFIGIVDVDRMMQWDFLEWIGRIKASWPWTVYGEKYTKAIVGKQLLSKAQKRIVTLYALINRISWAFENWIKCNENTTNIVDRQRYDYDMMIIQLLIEEYYGSKYSIKLYD